MKTPKLLDLFCCEGGAGEGYKRAGFDVTGIDIDYQPNNPHKFIQADAMEYVANNYQEYDFIHASPPCQKYSVTGNMYDNSHHPDLLPQVRTLLKGIGKPYVIENVPGSPMENFIKLRGDMFGLRVLRMRYFESNIMLIAPSMPKKKGYTSGKGKKYSSFDDGYYISVAGHNYRFLDGCVAMDIHWMSRKGLSQSVPPAYTQYIGNQLMTYWLSKNSNLEATR